MQAKTGSQLDALASNANGMCLSLKCPLCSKLLQNPVELRCNHMFCVSCIEQHSKITSYDCPVCTINTPKRNAKSAIESKGATTFIQSVYKQLKDTSKSNSFQVKKSTPILKEDPKQPLNGRKLNTKSSITPQTSKINSKQSSEVKTLPLNTKSKKILPTSPIKIRKSPEKVEIASKHTETHPITSKPIVCIPKHEQLIHPYQNNVMKWLESSQNMFHRNSQTQQQEVNESNVKIPRNLKSVSQRALHRRTLPPRQAKNPASKNNQRKCRSLESLRDRKIVPRSKLDYDTSIFDTPVDESELEETRIEDIDSNPLTKSMICKNIEEQCLEQINQNVTRQTATRKRKKPGDLDDTKNSSTKSRKSDWQRINHIAKVIDRVNKIPKKLKITTTPVAKENKVEEIKLDSQFSTTMPSQQREGLNESAPNVIVKSSIKRGTKFGEQKKTIRKIAIDTHQKEIEVSKRPKTNQNKTNNSNSTIVVNLNEDTNSKIKTKVIKSPNKSKTNDNINPKSSPSPKQQIEMTNDINSEDDDIFKHGTQPLASNLHEIIEETPPPIIIDDMFLAPTQQTTTTEENHSTSINTSLESKCEEFLAQYNQLNETLSTFMLSNSNLIEPNEKHDNFNKLILMHKHLQSLKPKFSNMSVILSKNDNSQQGIGDVLADQTTQTEAIDSVQTVNAHVQTSQPPPSCKMIQTSPHTPRCRKVTVDYGVQTSPKLSSAPKLPAVAKDDDVVMKNTLDYVDFDTQAAIKRAGKGKLETLTNVYTEQMPLSEFIHGMQMESPEGTQRGNNLNGSGVVMKSPNIPQNVSILNKSFDKKSRRKLYSSPLSGEIGATNKRAKPLHISDDEEEEFAPIVNKYLRDDISLSPHTESQKVNDEMNSPNVDKYLDAVWCRLRDQLDAPNIPETRAPEALQTAIKTKTQDLIATCEQMICGQLPKPEMSFLQPPPPPPPQNSKRAAISSTNLLADSIFGDNDDDIFENYATPSPCTSSKDSKDKPRSTLHNLHSDLIYKDSNSSILTNILDDNPLQTTAIHILQHVTIPVTNKPETNAINNRKSVDLNVSDDDLIYSTPETTPTKPRASLLDEIVLAPPADFQDGGDLGVKPLPSQRSEASQNQHLWNATQNTFNLSPIQASATRLADFCTQNANIVCKKLPFRRVTSTPHSKPFKSNPSTKPTPLSLVSLNKLNKSNHHQPSITDFMRKGNHSASPQLMPDDDDDLFVSAGRKKAQVVVACTRLDKTQMIAINALTKQGLARFSSVFDAGVTHLVVATNDANRAQDHTIKYVRAVAAGIWVVNCKWVQDSLIHKKLLPEEFYEVYDVSGTDGPKQSRLYRSTRPLFDRFKIHVVPPFDLITPGEIEEIIRGLGGITVSTPGGLLPKEDYICLIITETGQTPDDEQYAKYQDWADKLRVATVDFEWLTRSIGAYKLTSLRRFALCTDESLCELGYPENLLENVPCSFTQFD